MLVQSDQLSALLRLQLHLQQLFLLVQELVQVAELGLNALLQVSGVLLRRWRTMGICHLEQSLTCRFLKNYSGCMATKMKAFHVLFFYTVEINVYCPD